VAYICCGGSSGRHFQWCNTAAIAVANGHIVRWMDDVEKESAKPQPYQRLLVGNRVTDGCEFGVVNAFLPSGLVEVKVGDEFRQWTDESIRVMWDKPQQAAGAGSTSEFEQKQWLGRVASIASGLWDERTGLDGTLTWDTFVDKQGGHSVLLIFACRGWTGETTVAFNRWQTDSIAALGAVQEAAARAGAWWLRGKRG